MRMITESEAAKVLELASRRVTIDGFAWDGPATFSHLLALMANWDDAGGGPSIAKVSPRAAYEIRSAFASCIGQVYTEVEDQAGVVRPSGVPAQFAGIPGFIGVLFGVPMVEDENAEHAIEIVSRP